MQANRSQLAKRASRRCMLRVCFAVMAIGCDSEEKRYDEPEIVLVGQDDATLRAGNFLRVADIATVDDPAPGPYDAILFVVSAVDGSMPQTRTEIEQLAGVPHGPAAIFVVDAHQVNDPDLRALVVLELKQLLNDNQQPNVDAMSVIYDTDANVLERVRALID